VLFGLNFTGILAVLMSMSCLLPKWQFFIFDTVLQEIAKFRAFIFQARSPKRNFKVYNQHLFYGIILSVDFSVR
jgi:hypothetical protein